MQIDSFRETSAFAELVLRLGSASWLKPALVLRTASITPEIVQSASPGNIVQRVRTLRSNAHSHQLFHFMQPRYLYHHKEAAAVLWRVADVSSPALLRQTVMRSLIRDTAGADSIRAFNRFWTLTGNLTKSNLLPPLMTES